MKLELKYGQNYQSTEIDENKIINIIEPNEKKGLINPKDEIERALKNPISSVSLTKKLEFLEPENVTIIVNDITRPTPYDIMLPPILETLHKYGLTNNQIKFVIATGIHDAHTYEEDVEVLGKDIVDSYEVISHDADGDLIDMGTLRDGENRLFVNKDVYKSDFIITTGVILPHYFAGFSGGRKSILPGVAGRSTIEKNHSAMVKLIELEEINMETNPVNQQMIEGAARLGVDFILNVVTNSKREIVKVVAGHWLKAWEEGITTSGDMYEVGIKEKADLTIVSAGGHPRDINIYQSQKALDHAERATKENGIIVLLAEATGGYAEETFENWMKEADKPQEIVNRIKEKFVIGGHKAFAIAKVVKHMEVIIISEVNQKDAETLFFTKKDNLEEAYTYAKNKLDDNFTINIMPNGSLVVPKLIK